MLLSDAHNERKLRANTEFDLTYFMVCELLPSAPSIESASCFGDFSDDVTTQLEVRAVQTARTVLHRRVCVTGGSHIDRQWLLRPRLVCTVSRVTPLRSMCARSTSLEILSHFDSRFFFFAQIVFFVVLNCRETPAVDMMNVERASCAAGRRREHPMCEMVLRTPWRRRA